MAAVRWAEITDLDDPRVALFRHLRDAEARKSLESEHGVFVAEGASVIERLLRSDYRVRTVLLLPQQAERLSGALSGRQEVDVLISSRDVLAGTAGFDVHRGALAVAERRPLPGLADVLQGARAVAVLEGLTDHENLGAIARSARALGVDGLLLDPTCADPLYRRCVRVSMGEILFLPWTRAVRWPDELAAVRAAGFTIVALTPAADALPIAAVASGTTGPIALLLGAEGPGLSAAAMEAADLRVRIPLRAGTDSLNVGHAAAVAFHQLDLLRPDPAPPDGEIG